MDIAWLLKQLWYVGYFAGGTSYIEILHKGITEEEKEEVKKKFNTYEIKFKFVGELTSF